MIGLYCRLCGWMWDAVFKGEKIKDGECPNKRNHGDEKSEFTHKCEGGGK